MCPEAAIGQVRTLAVELRVDVHGGYYQIRPKQSLPEIASTIRKSEIVKQWGYARA
jgi:hypothetical protein